MLKYLPYVLLFALATVIIYSWGIVKSQRQQAELSTLLADKCAKKILKALKKQQKLSKAEVEQLLDGTQAGVFYSKQRIMVQNPKEYTAPLLKRMQEKNLIELQSLHGQFYYTLPDA